MQTEILPAHEWAIIYGVHARDHPLYQKFRKLYKSYLERGMDMTAPDDVNPMIPKLDALQNNPIKLFEDNYENPLFTGTQEIFITHTTGNIGNLADGTPLCFASILHMHRRGRVRWPFDNPDPTPNDIAHAPLCDNEFPSFVHIAHLGSHRSYRGLGRDMMRFLNKRFDGFSFLLEIYADKDDILKPLFTADPYNFIPAETLKEDDPMHRYISLASKHEEIAIAKVSRHNRWMLIDDGSQGHVMVRHVPPTHRK